MVLEKPQKGLYTPPPETLHTTSVSNGCRKITFFFLSIDLTYRSNKNGFKRTISKRANNLVVKENSNIFQNNDKSKRKHCKTIFVYSYDLSNGDSLSELSLDYTVHAVWISIMHI